MILADNIRKKVERIDRAARLERRQAPEMIQKTKAVRFPLIGIKFFEVIGEATGDGVYDCYKLSLDATEWADTAGDPKFDSPNAYTQWNNVTDYVVCNYVHHNGKIYHCTQNNGPSSDIYEPGVTEGWPSYWDVVELVEVLNLYENNPIGAYTPALGLYDKMKAYQMLDDEDEMRWVGIPSTPQIRQVRATEDAPAAENITCNLILNNDVEAIAGQLGRNIEVYARICGGGNLNSAVPRIADNDYLFAQNIQGKWWFCTNFQASEDCVCTV